LIKSKSEEIYSFHKNIKGLVHPKMSESFLSLHWKSISSVTKADWQ